MASGITGFTAFFPLPPRPEKEVDEQREIDYEANGKKPDRRILVDLRLGFDRDLGQRLFFPGGLMITHNGFAQR